mmetsp:Transcript_18704/g.28657  ORF Transcript_18704/g.28657 Transcript_18704/m.28657 type:complete len:248 (+) Transcript_18704:4905-5648(+)
MPVKDYFKTFSEQVIEHALLKGKAPLASNLIVSWVKAIFACAFPLLCGGSKEDLEKEIERILKVFMPLFDQQCLAGILFKMNSGSISLDLLQNGQQAFQQAKEKTQSEEFWGDELASMQLVGLRKVFLAIHLVHLTWNSLNIEDRDQREAARQKENDVFKKVIVQTSDKAEIQAIVEILGIDLNAENPFFNLPDEDDGAFFDAVEAPEEKEEKLADDKLADDKLADDKPTGDNLPSDNKPSENESMK